MRKDITVENLDWAADAHSDTQAAIAMRKASKNVRRQPGKEKLREMRRSCGNDAAPARDRHGKVEIQEQYSHFPTALPLSKPKNTKGDNPGLTPPFRLAGFENPHDVRGSLAENAECGEYGAIDFRRLAKPDAGRSYM
jgi:hypothetical protein